MHAHPTKPEGVLRIAQSSFWVIDRTLELLTISLGEVEKSEESCYMAEGVRRTAECCWVGHHSFRHPVCNLAKVADAIGLPIVVGDLVV